MMGNIRLESVAVRSTNQRIPPEDRTGQDRSGQGRAGHSSRDRTITATTTKTVTKGREDKL